MNAVGLYVSAARLVLQHDSASSTTAMLTPSPTVLPHPNDQRLLDLLRLLPHLRQSLSCAVCSRVLSDPYSLRDARCQHNVCRLCVRGRKNIRPSCTVCRDCQDFKTYEENKQMRCLLLCYKSLCEHLLGSSLFQQICKQRAPSVCLSSGVLVPTMSVQEFIMEGASYEDILSAFTSDLARPKLTQTVMMAPTSVHLPSITAPLVPITVPVSKSTTSPIPQIQLTSHASFPMPVVIKQEFGTTQQNTTSNAHITAITKTNTHSLFSTVSASSTTPSAMTLTTPPPALTIKNLKSIVDLSSTVQLTTASVAAAVHPPTTSLPPTVTYVSHASVAGGVVVPIVSTSSVTSAPLTIASAKLQSLSRQLAQQQQRNLVSVSTGTSDLKPSALTLKLAAATSSTASSSTISASLGVTATTATVTSQQVRNPPPIKTVSNGSAMYSVLYTGIGNKITIKRKTDGDDDSSQRKNVSSSSTVPPPTVFRQVSKTNPKRRGCRCGNATPTPGKLTCCGQRCPCYVDSKSCIGCKCRGCRNPHRPDGGKVRPVIPELACYEIQMADSENSALSPGELPIGTSTTTSSNKFITNSSTAATTLTSTITASQQLIEMPLDDLIQTQPQSTTVSRLAVAAPTSSTTTTATIQIPFRNLQQINAVHQQQHQQQQTHNTIAALNAHHNQQQQQKQQQIQLHQNTTQQHQSQTNLLQLENLQRESLLIQSAEGKYQVVNVFTTTNTQHNHNSSLQRIHTLPQLQAVTSNSSSSNVISNNNTTFLLQSPSSNATITSGTHTSASTAAMLHHHQMPEISTTLPQIIMQQQTQHHANMSTQQIHHQQQQHHQQLQRAHLQQQLKTHNNIITVHPITTHSVGNSQTKSAVSATIAPSSTITLAPIIVASPTNSTFSTSDLFSETTSEEFLSNSNPTTTTITISTPSSHMTGHTPTFTISSNNNVTLAGGGVVVAGTANAVASGCASQQHLTPAYVEVIESNDL